MAIVFPCGLSVCDYARAGKLVEVPEQACPGCGSRLGWWSGYWRKLHDAGGRVEIWVRRGRCPPCDTTHALLPDFVVERRRYAVEEIGRTLEKAAEGVSAWKSSELLDLPFGTVRDWRRRCQQRSGEQLAALSRLALKVGAQIKELPTRALVAMVATLKVVWARSRERDPGVAGLWRFWNLVFSGKGLAANTEPGWACALATAGMGGSSFSRCPMGQDPAEQVALFRYRVIAEALSERLSPAERGRLVRELAAGAHELPDGSRKEFSRATLYRWIRAYREGELAGLRPQPRSDQGLVRKQPGLLEEACRLRREAPFRSAEQISRILLARRQVRVSPRTISEHLRRQGLDRTRLTAQPRVYGRFEADAPNQVWIGDVLHGPYIPHPRVAGSRKAYLFLLLDDHSRLVLHGQFVTQENTRAGQQVLRAAILAHGLPEVCYFDNGSPYANAALERTCAVLGIRLVHSRPGQPAGRGKLERAFRAIREWFLSEATLRSISGFQDLNDKFTAWVHEVFNTRLHEETGQRPVDRFASLQKPRRPDLELLYEAFRWSAVRRASKTALVSLEGLKFQVDPALCGQRVELHYDPDDLSRVDVWFQGRRYGSAVPFVLGRHVQRQAPPAEVPPAEPTGVDYLGLLEQQHLRDSIGRLSYRDLDEEDSDA